MNQNKTILGIGSLKICPGFCPTYKMNSPCQLLVVLGPTGLNPIQFIPFQMALLMPDLVLAAAMEFERYGLAPVSEVRTEPAFDPDTLWRIPGDVNVVPVPLPIRKLRLQDLGVLNARRAGNRGRAKPKTE